MNRRTFFAHTAAGACLFSRRGWALTPGPDLEATIRWLRETPREQALKRAVAELRGGLPQAVLLDATLLAAVEEIRPDPVGFQYHAVMAAGAHRQLVATVSEPERVRPILWYVDFLKTAQERAASAGTAQLGAAPKTLPAVSAALETLTKALEEWDLDAADAAVTVCARSLAVPQVCEALLGFGPRCLVDLGHKAIATAVLTSLSGALTGEHRVAALRSLVAAQLAHGRTALCEPFAAAREAAARTDDHWEDGRTDDTAAGSLHEGLRTSAEQDGARAISDHLAKGVGPASLWDGVLRAAAEVSLAGQDIVSLHAFTATHALHEIALRSTTARTRLLALMQAAAWLPYYRKRKFGAAGIPAAARVDQLVPVPLAATGSRSHSLAADVLAGGDRVLAARRTEALGSDATQVQALCRSACDLVFARGDDSHDYKFLGAVLAELDRARPAARPALLAALPVRLPDPAAAEPRVTARIRLALGT